MTAVVDLRQYTLVPGRRDTLIDLFDSYFVDGQEAVGMQVIGQFRDLDDPDRFVWLRGFESMAVRGEALPAFYYGPVWRAHSEAANATMIDSDDALLLEPTYLGPGYPTFGARQEHRTADSQVGITVAYLAGPPTAADRALAEIVTAELTGAGSELVAEFVTHAAENNFTALPLREENVLVWVTRFADPEAATRHRARLDSSPRWNDALAQLAERGNGLPMQQLRLQPTPASRLR